MKTSAVAVRSVLRDGLEHPSGYQTARAGLATFTAVKLYRDGLDGRYKPLRGFPRSGGTGFMGCCAPEIRAASAFWVSSSATKGQVFQLSMAPRATRSP
jgi:hypothetical protein